jgi:hypothetical protein
MKLFTGLGRNTAGNVTVSSSTVFKTSASSIDTESVSIAVGSIIETIKESTWRRRRGDEGRWECRVIVGRVISKS